MAAAVLSVCPVARFSSRSRFVVVVLHVHHDFLVLTIVFILNAVDHGTVPIFDVLSRLSVLIHHENIHVRGLIGEVLLRILIFPNNVWNIAEKSGTRPQRILLGWEPKPAYKTLARGRNRVRLMSR